MVLELHKFEVAGNKRNAGEISRPHDLAHRPPRVVIADCAIKRRALANVEFRLVAKHGRKRRLRVEINRENPIAFEREKLRQIKRRRCLGRPTFEIGDCDDLQFVARPPRWQKGQRLFRTRTRQISPKLADLRRRIGAPAAGGEGRGGAKPVERQLPKVPVSTPRNRATSPDEKERKVFLEEGGNSVALSARICPDSTLACRVMRASAFSADEEGKAFSAATTRDGS